MSTVLQETSFVGHTRKSLELLGRISIDSLFWFQKIITVSGNRVLGRIYGVWEQGAGENIWCLGTGCWGEYMVYGNRVLGRIYGVWEQGAGDLGGKK